MAARRDRVVSRVQLVRRVKAAPGRRLAELSLIGWVSVRRLAQAPLQH